MIITDWISAIGTAMGSLAALLAVWAAWLVWQRQKLLSQRQLLLPLWEYLSKLNNLDRTAPVVQDVLNNINTLELVALCCEGEMIDVSVIKKTFLKPFISLYDQIKMVPAGTALGKSGLQLLEDVPEVTQFYEELKTCIALDRTPTRR
jgi:hypothetical protein